MESVYRVLRNVGEYIPFPGCPIRKTLRVNRGSFCLVLSGCNGMLGTLLTKGYSGGIIRYLHAESLNI